VCENVSYTVVAEFIIQSETSKAYTRGSIHVQIMESKLGA